MAFVNINGAYWQETAQGLQVVRDQATLEGLKAGKIPSSKQSSSGGDANRYSLPSMNETRTSELPQEEADSTPSSFQNFGSALNKAISLARSQRNDASLDLIGEHVKPGSVSAASFTSLLSDINTSFNEFSEPLAKQAMDVAKAEEDNRSSIRDLALKLVEKGATKETISGILQAPDIDAALAMAAGSLSATSDNEIRQVGRQLLSVDPDTGEVEVLFTGLNDSTGGGSEAGTGFFNSGGLRIDKAEIGQGSQMLAQSRGSDGFTNTDQYTQMYNHWVDQGGLPQDFLNQYDPDFYLNPDDPTIPSYIRSQMKKEEDGFTNPFPHNP